MNEQQLAVRLEEMFKNAMPGLKLFTKHLSDFDIPFDEFPKVKYHVTVNKQGQVRTWWLTYGIHVPCHVCQIKIIPIEEVWCGCKPIPRKMKKWCKGRRAVYKETG